MKRDFGQFLKTKQEGIQKALDQKSSSIEFTNALNNAVALYRTVVENKIEMEEAVGEVVGLVRFFRELKESLDSEKKAEQPVGMDVEKAVQNIEKVFNTDEKHAGQEPDRTPSGPQPQIKDPDGPSSDAQRRKIFVMFKKLGYDKDKQNELLKGRSTKDLTKSQASRVIEWLGKQEVPKQEQDEIPF